MRFIFSIIIVFFAMLVSNTISAQDRTITADQVFSVKGGASDTISGASGENTYTMYIKDFCNTAKIMVKQTKVSGTYSEGHYTISSSLDNSNWTTISSLNLHASTLTSARTVSSATLTPIAPYVKIYAAGGDSTGNQKIQYFILIDKN
jgi:hypothetical protein